jgi:antitoxin ParD1/3/4
MPTMNVSLTAEFAEFVEREIASGSYMSASEVVRDALRMMKRDHEMEAEKLHLLRLELERGLIEKEQRQFSSRSVDAIFEEVVENSRK